MSIKEMDFKFKLPLFILFLSVLSFFLGLAVIYLNLSLLLEIIIVGVVIYSFFKLEEIIHLERGMPKSLEIPAFRKFIFTPIFFYMMSMFVLPPDKNYFLAFAFGIFLGLGLYIINIYKNL